VAQPFTINGSGFASGANVTLRDLTAGESFPDRPVVSQTGSALVLSANFTVAPHSWSVEIINPDGRSSGQFPFSVVSADLVVESVTFAPAMVVAGNAFTMRFRIRNIGSGAAPASQARRRLSADVTLTATDLPLSPQDVSIPPLPSGESYEFSDSVIVPATTPPGTYHVGVFADWDDRANQSDATNDAGLAGSTLSVIGPGVPGPTITVHPRGRTATVGDTVSFDVQASGSGPLRYQWARDGGPITGATSATLSLDRLSVGQSGQYSVLVSNAGGTAGSTPALLTVNELQTPVPVPGQYLSGQLAGFVDPSLPTIVITHGWQPLDLYSGVPPGWVSDMVAEIRHRLERHAHRSSPPPRANILTFTWPEAYTGRILVPSVLVDPRTLPLAALRAFASARASAFAEGAMLARTLEDALGPSYSKGIHFIGHSFGSFVNAEAVELLAGFGGIQFTILDAPLLGFVPGDETLFLERLRAPRVEWVDNYIGNDGSATDILSPAVGDLVSGAAYGGGWFVPGNHAEVPGFYRKTIREDNNVQLGGFHFSRILRDAGGGYGIRPNPFWNPVLSSRSTLSLLPEVLAEGASEGFRRIEGFAVEATRSIRGQVRKVIRLVEQSPSAIIKDLTIPAGAAVLTFDFKLSQEADGDWITVSFNDILLFGSKGDGSAADEFQHVEIPLGNLAGRTGVLTIRLNSVGASGAELVVSNFRLLGGARDDTPRRSRWDWDGDGRADIGIYRDSTGGWYVQRSSDQTLVQGHWGAPALGDLPVPAHYDGDGKADIAIYRASTGEWYIQQSSDRGLVRIPWGSPFLNDLPVPADYEGDGKADIAI
jgi:hypothetical protein